MQILNPSLETPQHWQSFHYFPTLHLQRPPNHFRRRIQHFSGAGTDKNATQNSPKHAISSEKNLFSGEVPNPLTYRRDISLSLTLQRMIDSETKSESWSVTKWDVQRGGFMTTYNCPLMSFTLIFNSAIYGRNTTASCCHRLVCCLQQVHR